MNKLSRTLWILCIAALIVGVAVLTGCESLVASIEGCAVKADCHFCNEWVCIEGLTKCITSGDWMMIEYHGVDCGDTVWVCPDHTHRINQTLWPH